MSCQVRVFLDESMPRVLRHSLEPHDVSFVEQEGWKGRSNGALLKLITGAFEVLLTSDRSFAFQNDLRGRGLSVVVLPTNNSDVLRLSLPAIWVTLDELPYEIVGSALIFIRWNGRRTLRSLEDLRIAEREPDPVPRFGRGVP